MHNTDRRQINDCTRTKSHWIIKAYSLNIIFIFTSISQAYIFSLERERCMRRKKCDEWWKYPCKEEIVQNFTRCVIFQMTCLTLSIFLRLRAKGITSHPIFSKFIFFFSFSWAKQNNHFSIYSYENVNISKQPSPLVSCLYMSFIKKYDLTWVRISK